MFNVYIKKSTQFAFRAASHLLEYGAYRTVLSGLNLAANALQENTFSDSTPARQTVSYLTYCAVSGMFWLLQGYLLLPWGDHVSMYDLRTRRVMRVPNMWQLHHGSRENRYRQAAAYTLGYEIEPGDVVVDVGAYLGQFSLHAAETASRVIAIDPYASVNDCLQRNVANTGAITIYPVAAWNRDETLSIQLSHYPSDTSLLQPDILPTGREVEVPGRTISSICADAGVDSVDVLKIEAEGVEPEILQGAPNARKIIVNCGPERRGEKPTETVVQMLRQRGYDVRVVLTDEGFAPNYGESPGLSNIEMVFAEYDPEST